MFCGHIMSPAPHREYLESYGTYGCSKSVRSQRHLPRGGLTALSLADVVWRMLACLQLAREHQAISRCYSLHIVPLTLLLRYIVAYTYGQR